MGLLFVGSLFVRPAPPKHVVIAAGPRDGAYYWFAQRYAETFKANGVDLQIRETAGTVENYRLLAAGQADLAMTQAGAAPTGWTPRSGRSRACYLEPVWVFYRGEECNECGPPPRPAAGGRAAGQRDADDRRETAGRQRHRDGGRRSGRGGGVAGR